MNMRRQATLAPHQDFVAADVRRLISNFREGSLSLLTSAATE